LIFSQKTGLSSAVPSFIIIPAKVRIPYFYAVSLIPFFTGMREFQIFYSDGKNRMEELPG
jgi:hypothetical protein